MSTHKPVAKLLDYRGAIALVIANTIGTGVFTTSGFALADLGSPEYVMLAWFVGGLYALSGVVIYSDLATYYPHTGGEYVYLRNSLHPALGTVAGWVSLVAGFTSPIAAAALGAQMYWSRVVSVEFVDPWVASAIVVLLGCVHAISPNWGVRLQNYVVLIKVIVILVFIGFGASVMSQSGETTFRLSQDTDFPLVAFAGSMVWISFAYSGWNAAVYVTSEVEGGGHAVKKALYIGTLIVTFLYLGVSAVILYGAPSADLIGVAESGAAAAKALGGLNAEKALSALITLALITSVSSMLISGPRVYAQMARDGALPSWIASLQGEHPVMAVMLQTFLSLLLIFSVSLRQLLEFSGVMLSLSAGVVVIAWFRLVFRGQIKAKFLRMLIAAVFLFATLGIAVASYLMRPSSIYATLCLVFFGLLVHVIVERFVQRKAQLISK